MSGAKWVQTVRQDMEKLKQSAFFTSIFANKMILLEPQVTETWGKGRR